MSGDTAPAVPRPAAAGHGLLIAGLVTAAYAAVVIVGAAYHEMWRDEVVPLSIARELPSLADLWRMVRHEGHPIFWYLVLRWSHALVASSLVLPSLAIVFAGAAVFLFVARAPLPLWLKVLFVFGYFPLFEYAVMARGNGLAMLLLFAFCTLYTERHDRPYAIALILGALANTTAMGFLVASAAAGVVVIDAALGRTRPIERRHVLASALCALLLLHSPLSTMPDRSVVPLDLYQHDLGSVLAALRRALVTPGRHAASVYRLPSLWIWILLFWLALLRRPALFVFVVSTMVGFELVFELVYPASPRHLGYFLLVTIAALWLGHPWDRTSAGRGVGAWAEWALQRVLLAAFAVMLVSQARVGFGAIAEEVQLDASSSKRLADILAGDPALARAIVLAEPESLGLAVRYYRDNPIYLPQEKAFRDWLLIQVPGGRRKDMSLGEVLATATDLRTHHGVPVVVVLGWRVDGPDVQRAYMGTYFDQTFTIEPDARTAFLARAELIARLRNAPTNDENYDVFVIR